MNRDSCPLRSLRSQLSSPTASGCIPQRGGNASGGLNSTSADRAVAGNVTGALSAEASASEAVPPDQKPLGFGLAVFFYLNPQPQKFEHPPKQRADIDKTTIYDIVVLFIFNPRSSEMPNDFDLDDDLEALEAEGLIQSTDNADDLTYFVVEEELPQVARTKAAEKLLKLRKDGRKGGVTLDHLTYVGDHAEEPYKSEANQIIRDRL